MGDLTTLDRVKAYMRIDPADLSEDETLMGLITDASTAVRDYTGRLFTTPKVREVRTLRTVGGDRRLYLEEVLSKADIFSISTPEGITLARWSWEPDRRMATAGSFVVFPEPGLLADLPPDHLDWFVYNLEEVPTVLPSGSVLVDANWGYSTVPAAVEYYTRRVVAIWDRSENSHFSEFYETTAGAAITPSPLPPQVARALEPWKLPTPAFA